MKHSIALLLSLSHIVFLNIPVLSDDVHHAELVHLKGLLEERIQMMMTGMERLRIAQGRREVLRKKINEINDETRVTSFELNFVPRHCVDEKDRYIVLRIFASVIGMEYNEDDIVEIKFFVKKYGNPMSTKDNLNYIVKTKTLAQKEKWMHCFLNYARNCGYSEVFDFPGVSKKYVADYGEFHKNKYYEKRYTLVNVTMRDHLSPFKTTLMAVIRGKIKPRRHYFRVKVNRSRVLVDRLLPLKNTVRHFIDDFSDIFNLPSI